MPNTTTVIADPGRQDLTIIREFDAPRELVFKAHVDRDLYIRWIGPRDLTTTIEWFDMRDGGCWRVAPTWTTGATKRRAQKLSAPNPGATSQPFLPHFHASEKILRQDDAASRSTHPNFESQNRKSLRLN